MMKKKLSALTLFIFASSLFAQVQLGKNVQIGFGSGTGSGTVANGTPGQFAQYPADGTTVQGATLSGDGTLALGGTFTLSTVNSTPGSCGDSTHIPQFTVNGKGLTTACTPIALASPFAGANGIVFNTSTTTSRNALFSDVVHLWTSCSGYLKSDGTCDIPSGTPSVGASGTIQAADGAGAFAAASSANMQTAIGAGIYDASGAAGTSGFTVVVAASNSVNKASANIVCSGTADQTCLQNAVALCPNSQTGVAGCRVALQDGIYNLSATFVIDSKDDVDFGGINHCMWGGYFTVVSGTPNSPPLAPVGAIGTGCAQLYASTPGITMLQVSDSGNNCGTGTDTGRCRGFRIHNVYFVGQNYTGTAIAAPNNDDHFLIDNNIFQRLFLGMSLHLDSPTIRENSCQDMINCINFAGEYGQITDNLLFDITGTAIQITSVGGIVHNNTIGDCLGIGVSAAANNVIVEGNTIRNCIQPVVVSLGSTGVHVQNNAIYTEFNPITNSTHPAITVADGSGMIISGNTGNTYYGNGGPFIDMGTSTYSSVVNNNILGPWNYGGTAINSGSGTNITGLNLASFVPAVGPAAVTSASLQAAYNASSITGVSNGSPLPSWKDDAGFNRTITNGTTTAPTYISSSPINSLPAVKFDGVGNGLSEAEAMLPPTQPKTIFAVISLTSLGKLSMIATSTTGVNTNSLSVDTTNHLSSYAGTYVVSTLPTMTTATTYVVELVNNGASGRLAQNGASQTINNGSNIWSSGISIGADSAAHSSYFPGYIAAEYIYTGAMTTTDAAAVGAALCTTYGVTCGTSW